MTKIKSIFVWKVCKIDTCHTSLEFDRNKKEFMYVISDVNLLIVKLTGKLTKCSLFLKCVAGYIILFFKISIKMLLFWEVDFNKIKFQVELLLSSYN